LELFDRKILTVSQLTEGIKDLLESNFDEVWVEGEISNLRRPPSGHVYFTLKDENSQIKAVIFKMQIRYARFDLEDGLHVLCWGRVGIYQKRGEYQLILDYVEPRGIGSLQLAFEQLKERLAEEGLFDEVRKRALPLLPTRIGIVTSPTGAVIRDVLHIVYRRFDNIAIVLYPVRVQGEGAAEEIARGITYLGEEEGVDVIIAGRGGGSLEDLWAFNEEVVARAIVESPVPVISAVGHETDFTIADFVADVRAPTPSAAAELVVQNKRDILKMIEGIEEEMIREMVHILNRKREEVKSVGGMVKDPRRKMEEFRLRLDECWSRLGTAVRRTWRENRERINRVSHILLSQDPSYKITSFRDILRQKNKGIVTSISTILSDKAKGWEREMARLEAMSPLAILQRGYSITRRLPDGKIIMDAQEVEVQDTVEVKLFKGHILCQVEGKG
jgi:exodeoxyribonuclease VII large subunit